MKGYKLTLTVAALTTLLAGCETPEGNPDRTATGALIGAGGGAAAGALLGGRNAGPAALVGGALGALTGALIGHSMDEDEQARLRAEAPQTYYRVEQGQPLSIADVKALSNAKVSDDVIISQIQTSHTVYHLSANDIIDLHNSGVSSRVVDYMINTPSTATAPAPTTTTVEVSQAPPPPESDVVVASPGPGYVWVGGEWVWNGRWVWAPGYWAAPPYAGAIWVRPYWVRGRYGWRREPGHWR